MALGPELWRSSDTALLTELRRTETQSRQLDAHRYALIGELTHRGTAAEAGYASPARLLMDLLLISRAEANRRITLAEALTPRRPLTGPDLPPLLAATANALTEGELGVEHAEIIRRTLTDLPPEITQAQCDTAETALVDAAGEIGPAGLAAMARELRARLDQDGHPPTDTELRHPHNELRYVTKTNGRLTFKGELDPEGAGWLTTVIGPLAAPKPATTDGPDPRSLPQRQGDALIEALRLAATCNQLPTDGGERPTLLITLPLDALRDHLPPNLFNQPTQPKHHPDQPHTNQTHTNHTETNRHPESDRDVPSTPTAGRSHTTPHRTPPDTEPTDPTDNPATGDPVADGPVADGPAADGPVTGGPVIGGPATDDAAADGPVTGDPATGGPATGGPATDDAAPGDLTADGPPDPGQPLDDRPGGHPGDDGSAKGPPADNPVGDRHLGPARPDRQPGQRGQADGSTASPAARRPPNGASSVDYPAPGTPTAGCAGPGRSNPFALLDGIGLIDARIARRLACDCAIIPIVLGANSEPLDSGRKTR